MASARHTIAQNDIKSLSNPARITAIGGNNESEFYLNFPFLPPGEDWVFPFTYGFMFPVDSPTYQPIKVDASQTPGGYPPAPVTSKIARLVAYDTEQIFNPGVVAPLTSQVPAPGNISATLAAAGTTTPLAAQAGKTVTVYEVYLMLDAASATPAGGIILQDTSGVAFGAISAGVVNPPPWHGGVSGVKLPIGRGFQLLNNSGASITVRGCVINVQA